MLLCKPKKRKQVMEGEQGICLRSLQPNKDAAQLMTGAGKEEWIQVHQTILASADAHAWAAIRKGLIIGQLDIYAIVAGELGKHFQANAHDAVLQYRMLPAASGAAMHRELLLLFLQYYFDNQKAGLLYAQVNIYDGKTCRLYESAGFIFQQNTMLSSQAVSLYLMTRAQLNEQCKKV